MKITKSELRAMIREALREELSLHEAANAVDNRTLIDAEGYMSSVNSTVQEKFADLLLASDEETGELRTLPANKLVYQRIALDEGRNREFRYTIAQNIPADLDLKGRIGDSDIYKAYKFMKENYKDRKDMSVEHKMTVGAKGNLYYSIILKPSPDYTFKN